MSTTGRAITWLATALAVALASIPIWNSLGPNGIQIDPTGFVSMAVVLSLLSIGVVKVRPSWAPEVARSVGWVVAAMAWFGAIVADFSTESATNTTVSIGVSVLVVASAYAVCLRPDADNITYTKTVSDIADAVVQRLTDNDANPERH